MTSLLAFDIATATGWAHFVDGEYSSSGFIYLDEGIKTGTVAFKAESKDERMARRVFRLRRAVIDLVAKLEPTDIAWENSGSGVHQTMDQARQHGGLRFCVLAIFHDRDVFMHPIGVPTAKKALTGNHHAKKPEMVAAAKRRFGLTSVTHDQADAIGVALAATAKMMEESF